MTDPGGISSVNRRNEQLYNCFTFAHSISYSGQPILWPYPAACLLIGHCTTYPLSLVPIKTLHREEGSLLAAPHVYSPNPLNVERLTTRRQQVPYLKSLVWPSWDSNLRPPDHGEDALEPLGYTTSCLKKVKQLNSDLIIKIRSII